MTTPRRRIVPALALLSVIAAPALAAAPAKHPAAKPAAAKPAAPTKPAPVAAPVGDPVNGQKRFRAVCETCHLASRTATPNDLLTKIAPNLAGVVGRKAGTYPRYRYSSAMKNSGYVWTRENLKAYAMAPQKMIPNVRMSFGGLKNPKDADDIIAWLATQ